MLNLWHMLNIRSWCSKYLLNYQAFSEITCYSCTHACGTQKMQLKNGWIFGADTTRIPAQITPTPSAHPTANRAPKTRIQAEAAEAPKGPAHNV